MHAAVAELRVLNRLLKRVRDFAQVSGTAGLLLDKWQMKTLARLEVDRYGLDRNDRRIFKRLLKHLRWTCWY